MQTADQISAELEDVGLDTLMVRRAVRALLDKQVPVAEIYSLLSNRLGDTLLSVDTVTGQQDQVNAIIRVAAKRHSRATTANASEPFKGRAMSAQQRSNQPHTVIIQYRKARIYSSRKREYFPNAREAHKRANELRRNPNVAHARVYEGERRP